MPTTRPPPNTLALPPDEPSPDSNDAPTGAGFDAGHFPTPEAGEAERDAARPPDSRLPAVRAAALADAGYISMNLGHLERADSLLREALALGRRLGEKGVAATAIMWLGMVTLLRGDSSLAEGMFAESLALFREAGDEWGRAGAATLLGSMIGGRGNFARGRMFLEESLEIYRRIGDEIGAGASLNNLGYMTLFSGDYEGAATFLEESIVICQRHGNRVESAPRRCNLAHAKLLAGEPAEAEKHYRAAIGLCREEGQSPTLAETLEGMAASSAERGCDLRAANLSGAAEALSEAMDFTLAPEARRLLSPFFDKARAPRGSGVGRDGVEGKKDDPRRGHRVRYGWRGAASVCRVRRWGCPASPSFGGFRGRRSNECPPSRAGGNFRRERASYSRINPEMSSISYSPGA